MKVYSKKEIDGCWWVSELTDIFYFKGKDLTTGIEEDFIFSWSRGCDLSEYEGEPVRKYDIEIDGDKYYFLVYTTSDGYLIKPENSNVLESLSTEKNILLTGSEIEVVQ
jgi:hypothetical protein